MAACLRISSRRAHTGFGVLLRRRHRPAGVLRQSVRRRPQSGNVESSPLEDDRFRLEGNAYIALGGQSTIKWGDLSNRIADWTAATGQETVAGRPTAIIAGPDALCAAGQGRTMFPRGLRALGAYRLRGDSPLVDRALDLRASAVKVGPRDYFGNPVPAGNGFDVGAHEYRAGESCG